MGFRFTVLILLLLGGASEAGTGGKRPLCLVCHPVHYGERGSCVSCHRGNDRSDRRTIAHNGLVAGRYAAFTLGDTPPVVRGRALIDTFACRRCHRVGGRGNRLASDLDAIILTTPPSKAQGAVTSPALFMPDFRFGDRQAVDIVNALLAGGRKAGPEARETPVTVHFAENEGGRENPFRKNCAPCHKALSQRFGGVGKGDIGPNLSGLFTEFYPATLPGNRRWNETSLRQWLKNPRKLRPNARMQPLLLGKAEQEGILETLR